MIVNKLNRKSLYPLLLLTFFLILGFFLRSINLTNNPPGLNWDETSVGYNAYSLSLTGKDEFGKPWPIYMEAFGEYKIGLYSMFLAPIVRLFGLSIFTVRFPNVIFGCLLILASYYLSLQIFKKRLTACLVAGLVAISPWAIHTSRTALEWYFGMPLLVFGLAFLLKSRKKVNYLLPASLFLSASLYSYHNLRVFLPLFLLGFAVIYRQILIKHKKKVLISLLAGLFILVPLFLSMKSTAFLSRVQAVSILKDEGLQSQLMEGIFRHNKAKLPFLRAFNNKLAFYSKEVLDRYLAHFSPGFLFSGEDVTPRIGIEKVGKLYYASIPFLLLGLAELITKKRRLYKLLLLWLLLAPLSSSFTLDTPHALRSFILVPPLQIITVLGMVKAYQYFRFKKSFLKISFIGFVLLAYLTGFLYFLWRYSLFYPEDSAGSWQVEHQQMIKILNQHKDRFDKVVITTYYGQPHIFVAFFTPIEPQFYQKEVSKEDQNNILNERVPHLGRLEFKQIENKDFCLPNTLIVIERRATIPQTLPKLDVVRHNNRFHEPEIIFEFYDTNNSEIQTSFCSSD